MEKKIGDVNKIKCWKWDVKNIPPVITTVFNTKIGEVERKKPDVSGSVNKTNYNTKTSDIHAI